jgi:hypothetical protein
VNTDINHVFGALFTLFGVLCGVQVNKSNINYAETNLISVWLDACADGLFVFGRMDRLILLRDFAFSAHVFVAAGQRAGSKRRP